MQKRIARASRFRCPKFAAERRARRRARQRKRSILANAPFLDRFKSKLEALAEKEGFALQRAPIGDRETIYCRAAQACTSHAAKYGCEEKVWGAKKSGKGNAAARSIPLAAPSKRPQQTR